MEVYILTSVVYLSAFNYKIKAKIGVDKNFLTRRLTVLDTGAGPNLIRAELLPDETINALDKKRQIVNLASASNYRPDTLRIINLTVEIGG